jgi:hypothetical protein
MKKHACRTTTFGVAQCTRTTYAPCHRQPYETYRNIAFTGMRQRSRYCDIAVSDATMRKAGAARTFTTSKLGSQRDKAL